MPVSLTKDLNLITRPVVQVYNSAPYQTSTGDRGPNHHSAIGRSSSSSRRRTAGTGARRRTDVHLSTAGSVYRARESSGRARARRRLHDGEVHPRGLPAAVVVVRRRREPPERQPDEHPADHQPLLRGWLERRLLGQHPRPTGGRRQTIGGPCRSASASARSSSSAGFRQGGSPASTWSCSRTPVENSNIQIQLTRCSPSSSRARLSSEREEKNNGRRTSAPTHPRSSAAQTVAST